MQSVSESLESNIVSALQNSRKFQILTRSDLPEAMKEADFANSGNSAGSKNFSFKGADYILTVKINDFQDYIKTANFALLGKSAQKRIFASECGGKYNRLIDGRSRRIRQFGSIRCRHFRSRLRRPRKFQPKPGAVAKAVKSSRRQNCRARHGSGFPVKWWQKQAPPSLSTAATAHL